MNIMKTPGADKRRPGRPLSFDREKALHKAMVQFWRTGYETTSVSALTRAMEITAPSLYAAFVDKETLFLETLHRYGTLGPKTARETIREAPSAREAARRLLEGSAHWFTQEDTPSGCLVASAASTGSDTSSRVRAALRQARCEIQDALQEKAQQDIQCGRLPIVANAFALSAVTVALIQGMSTLARDGASRTDLLQMVDALMAAWPSA